MHVWGRLRASVATFAYPDAWLLPPRLWRPMRESLRLARPVASPVGIVLHAYAPPIGGKGYRVYLRGLRRMARGDRVPLIVHLSVTDRCGYACPRCSNGSNHAADPPLEVLRDLLDRLRDAGTAMVAFTGGEPALRDDLEDLIAHCGKSMSPLLFTSGQNLDAARARRLRKAGLELAFVSLDHFRAERHDAIRGAKGAFEQALCAIRGCLDAGLYTAAQTVVGKDLLESGQLETHLEFCAKLGVHETMLLEPIGYNASTDCVSEAQRVALQEIHLRSLREAGFPKVTAAPFLESDDAFGCQAGYSFLYIATNGEVFPCDFVPCSLGNVHADALALILERVARVIPCATCGCLARELVSHDVPRREAAEALLACREPTSVPRLALGKHIGPRHETP